MDPVLLPVERLIYRLCGVHPATEQTWVEYTVSMLLFSVVGMVVLYALERLQYFPAAQSAGLCRGRARPGVQHRGKLYDQHQLAGVLGRIDHELPDPDGGTRLPQLRFGRCGPGDRDRGHSGFCSAQRPNAGKLLVRSRPQYAVGAASDLHHFHPGSGVAGRTRKTSVPTLRSRP